jgi:hypothetical protein
VVNGRLFSFADLRHSECTLFEFCDRDVEQITAMEWLRSEPERQPDYVYLLNQLLGEIQYDLGLKYSPDYERTYFPRANSTEKEFKVPWFNVRTNKPVEPRIVVKYYEYGLDRFWRHLACHLSFLRFNNAWFLRIIPKYFFTSDGQTPCEGELAGPYTTRLKAMEHNMQVLNHVLFWADYLSHGNDYISYRMDRSMILNVDKKPLTGITAFAIPDDPALFEEKLPSRQLSLFEIPTEEADD